ncbi:MAG TPA: metalloregulator ArsR/SmtB family transcription factor [Candidatus Eisenbacteria bacterium]|jgi:DNA-binding transcriptional ArsR family regulator
MVNYSTAALDATFAALSDPTRRGILARLSERPGSSVSDLARPFEMSLPAISKHLRVLEGAGLVVRRKEGRVHHLRLVPAPLEEATDWIARYRGFWEEKLDALDGYLRREREEASAWPPHRRESRRRSTSRGRPGRRPPGRTRRG